MSGEARELFARFIPDGDIGSLRRGAAGELCASDFTGTMTVLRDQDFHDLARRTIRGPSERSSSPRASPTLSSRSGSSRAASARSTSPRTTSSSSRSSSRRHSDEIDAISRSCCLGRRTGEPSRCESCATHSVMRPSTSPRQNLQQAFKSPHHKALVDIISMVKRAARRDVTAAHCGGARQCRGRRGRAPDASSTEAQAKWMDYIRQHLVQNLSIEPR